ncbi:MAG: ABC transporter permease [Chloroherpetonaceae bacterium]|nr:ABC transporter permease [Chloroherpetonaceae bacterium]
MPENIMRSRIAGPREWPTLLLVVLVSAGMALAYPAFRTAANLTTVGQNAAFIGIMACGQSLVVLSAGLDLSVGSVLALSGCATAEALQRGIAWPVAALIGLMAGALAGGVNGALITYRRLPPILTTLATLLLFRYGTHILTGARNYGPFPEAFNTIGNGWTPLFLLLIVTALCTLMTLRTRFGRQVIAIGGNEQAVRLSGVDVDRIKRRVYTLSGLCAALGGLIVMAFNNNTQSNVGQGYELDVIAACVVGGIRITGGEGSLPGAALGALLIALLRDALILTGRPTEQYGLFTGAVILLAAGLERWRARQQERARRVNG